MLPPASTATRSFGLSMSSSHCPSHYMQEWGYLRDSTSVEKICVSSVNCESEKEKGEKGVEAEENEKEEEVCIVDVL